jgi:hypothetical protein
MQLILCLSTPTRLHVRTIPLCHSWYITIPFMLHLQARSSAERAGMLSRSLRPAPLKASRVPLPSTASFMELVGKYNDCPDGRLRRYLRLETDRLSARGDCTPVAELLSSNRSFNRGSTSPDNPSGRYAYLRVNSWMSDGFEHLVATLVIVCPFLSFELFCCSVLSRSNELKLRRRRLVL